MYSNNSNAKHLKYNKRNDVRRKFLFTIIPIMFCSVSSVHIPICKEMKNYELYIVKSIWEIQDSFVMFRDPLLPPLSSEQFTNILLLLILLMVLLMVAWLSVKVLVHNAGVVRRIIPRNLIISEMERRGNINYNVYMSNHPVSVM